MHRTFQKGLLGMGCGLVLATAAGAAEFPSKPISLVIPYPPGGATSLHGGIVATGAEPVFGQPMVPVIRAGGGGVAGAAYVLKQPADGHTLLLGDVTINSLRPLVEKDIPFKVEDFTPIARVTLDPLVFVASPAAPFKTLKEMVDFAKANPEKLVYSSDNLNGWTYVAFKALQKATDTKMKGIEFGGGGPAVANILGGNTMAYAGAPAVVGEHILSGKLVAICTAGEERAPTLKDVPTCKEAGADVIWQVWLGLLVHKDTPADRVAVLREKSRALLEDKGLLSLVGRINSKISYLDRPEWEKALATEQTRLKAIYEVGN